MRRRPTLSVLAAAVTALVLGSLLVAEVALQIASLLSSPVARVLAPPWRVDSHRIDPFLPDDRLIVRGNPRSPGHDSAGYRNPRRLAAADIVVLGDSQTYGTSVAAGTEWPARLAHLTGRSVYNMAVPTYGPGHYLLQLDEALSLRPTHLVVAMYFGNDLFDAYLMGGRHARLAELAPASLRSEAAALERTGPLEQQVERLFSAAQVEVSPPPGSATRRWVSEHLKLWGLARAVKRQLASRGDQLLAADFATATRALSPAQRQYAAPFDDGSWRTILTAPYRLAVVDTRDPRIHMGFEVSRVALRLIAERCRAADVRLLVALIPLKESVFWPHVPDPDRYPALREAVQNARRLTQQLIATLENDRVPYVDLLDPLLRAPSQPYFPNADGHPNPVGHEIIARATAQALGVTVP